MCTQGRYIFNRYSRRHVFVKCGKCPACRQERATARAQRIKNNLTDGTICLFVTLTYSNDFVPFIYRSDLMGYGDLNVYRHNDIRYVYDRFSNKSRLKKDCGIRPISTVNQFDIDCSNKHNYKSLKGLDSDKLGVCWYPDIQDFFKRLRQILIRDYNYARKFSFFCCSEVGSHTHRPHFHTLIFIQRDAETTFRSAICKAWPYADRFRTEKYIEIAKDAANYVASYVNCHSDLLPLLQSSYFRPKHSSSKDFGVVLDCFSLRSILSKIDTGDLRYYRQQRFNGTTAISAVPIPLYVINRYFPKFKGFSWLSTRQVRSVLLCPATIGDVFSDCTVKMNFKRDIYCYDSEFYIFRPCLVLNNSFYVVRQPKIDNPCYSFSPRETYQIYVRLENAYQRFHKETGLSRYDYAYYYERVYSLYSSMILRLSHEDKNFEDYADFYENAYEVIDDPDLAPTLSNLTLLADPNKRHDIVEKTAMFTRLYDRLDKQKSVTNYCMDKIGHNV